MEEKEEEKMEEEEEEKKEEGKGEEEEGEEEQEEEVNNEMPQVTTFKDCLSDFCPKSKGSTLDGLLMTEAPQRAPSVFTAR